MKKTQKENSGKHLQVCAATTHTGFTLPEILIAVAIFAAVATMVGSLYTRSFGESRRSNTQGQVYGDARYVLSLMAKEIKKNAIDYDEYYNQNVVIPTIAALGRNPAGVGQLGLPNFGQNFGRYYSSFFNPGSDFKLGFECNDGGARNRTSCTPKRKTMDRNTGSNPFDGKYDTKVLPQNQIKEDAFCGILSEPKTLQGNVGVRRGKCLGKVPNPKDERMLDKLYLISAKGDEKTILARELTDPNMYVLSILKMAGYDTNEDEMNDSFACADGFECLGTDDIPLIKNTPVTRADGIKVPGELPRAKAGVYADLTEGDSRLDPASSGFSKEFVPISPLRINIKSLNFLISPAEDPRYAFAEIGQIQQPKVTIVMTAELNPNRAGASGDFIPITFMETVISGVTAPIPAPIKQQ